MDRVGRPSTVVLIKAGQGVRDDLMKLVNEFTAKGSIRYEDFSSVWKDQGMCYLFAGRADLELREAVDTAINECLMMFISHSDSSDILKRSCAIYMLYAIFHTQCLVPRVKIRATPQLFEELLHFTQQMATKEHYDLVFIFTRLRMEKAFDFVATLVPQGGAKKKQSNQPKATSSDAVPSSVVSTFADISMDVIEDLSVLQEEYIRVKCAATNSGDKSSQQAQPPSSLRLVSADFISQLRHPVAKFDEWRKTGKISGAGKPKRSKGVRRKVGGTGNATTGSESDTVGTTTDNLTTSDSDSTHEQLDDSQALSARRKKLRQKGFTASPTAKRAGRRLS